MNLKEAFRFQNRLHDMSEEAIRFLDHEPNITKVQNTYLRKKVMAGAEDETTVEAVTGAYSDRVTELADFLLWLLEEREKLAAAIAGAKAALEFSAGFDGEVGLNARRQGLAALFRRMAELRASETLIPNGGIGYRFNNEGNQVTYLCDVKRVVTINFDRRRIRRLAAELSRKADGISSALDAALIGSRVEYAPPFDVNDSFSDVFEDFLTARRPA